jgi:UDP-glucose:(heptosyl)LPS alpha-1,3-glucosyltransferase
MPQRDIIFLKSLLGAGGGLEKYTLRLAKAFVRRGFNVTILTTTSKKRPLPKEPGIEIISLHKEGFFSFFNVIKFDKEVKKQLKRKPAAFVFGLDRNSFQTHYRAGNGVHASYLERRKQNEGFLKKLSFSLNPLHKVILNLEQKTFESPDLKTLFTNSNLVKEEINKFYKVDPKKIVVVHNGVEWSEMQDSFDNQSYFTSGPTRLLFVGHGYKRKGLDLLLKALSKVKSPFVLSVVGKDKQLEEFKKLSKKLNLEDKVQFFGPQQDIRSFYKENEVLVFPSTYDPFANVTLEALAMGLFVVTSTFNGASEIIPKDCGIIINDIYKESNIVECLEKACQKRKTKTLADSIRQSVAHLEFNHQLNKIIDITLCPTQDISFHTP